MDVTLVLTHDCNLGCGYCYAGRKFKKVMPRETAKAGLELAFSDAPKKVQISYFGGEPTLEWDLLVTTARDARALAEARGVTLLQSVTTNGTLLTAPRVKELAELDVYVALSIDGNRVAHDANRPRMGGGSSYDDVSRGLDLLLAEGKPFETISVLTPASVGELGASVSELFARGVPRVSLNPCWEAAWSDEALAVWERGLEHAAGTVAGWMRLGRTVSLAPLDAKILARLKGGLEAGDTCSLGDTSIAVAPSGNLYACERLVGEDEIPEHVIGHVSRGRDRTMRSAMPEHHAQNDECGSCAERGRCSAYCACANLAETGDASIAGGVQCWYERTTMRLADMLAERLLAEKNETFLAWFLRGSSFDRARWDAWHAGPAPRELTRSAPRRSLPVVP